MEVADLLAAVRASIDHHPVALLELLLGSDLLRHKEKVPEKQFVFRPRFIEILQMLARQSIAYSQLARAGYT